MGTAQKNGKTDVGQNLADYEPTPKERNLLEVMLNPESRMWSVTEICKKADCVTQTYYNAFDKEGFVKLWDKQAKGVVQGLGCRFLMPVSGRRRARRRGAR